MNKWWIDEPFLLGGSNPSEADLRNLRRDGFTIIVGLLNEPAERPGYDPETAEAFGYRRYCIRIPDFNVPSLSQIYEFIDHLARIPKSESVLVHCQGGSGRTGTMGAAYWIAKGESAADAMRRVRQANPHAVETEGQERVLHEFEANVEEMLRAALDTFKKLVALLYREVGVLTPRNHSELAAKRRLESGFFATPARKSASREIYQRHEHDPNAEACLRELETLTGLSLHDVERAFREGAWKDSHGGYSYGGPKWARIAEVTILLGGAIADRDTARVRLLLAEVDALEHNNGPIVDKFSELRPN